MTITLGLWPSASSDQRSRSRVQPCRGSGDSLRSVGQDASCGSGASRQRAGVASGAPQSLSGAHERAATAPQRQRKPDWIRVKAPTSEGYAETRKLMRELGLATVCEEAACPNIGECWTKKHATVMILGDTCTRACAFCNVKTGMPRAVDPLEPEHVAIAAAELGLEHIVVTSVDRDDLPDGGASQFVKVIEALRKRTPATTIEILTPDFRNKREARSRRSSRPAPTSTTTISRRCRGSIRRSARARATMPRCGCSRASSATTRTIFTKSGVMVGLGEQRLEVHQVMDDMRSAGVDFLTMGQYLQPTPRHAKVEEFVTPQAFDAYAAIARAKGFLLVAAIAADPLELSRRRRFPEDAGSARRRSWPRAGADASP